MVPFFLNEKSFPIEGDEHEILLAVKSLLSALRLIRKTAREFCLGCETRLSSIALDMNYRTLSALLEGADREWWRFAKRFDEYSPFEEVPQCIAPLQTHVDSRTTSGDQALLWACKNDCFLVSFPSSSEWREAVLSFRKCECTDDLHSFGATCEVRNISNVLHVEHWQDAIRSFEYSEAVSSTIYAVGGLVIKMYLNDHNPPHVHVFLDGSNECAGVVRFDTYPEVLQGRGLVGDAFADVVDILHRNREGLFTSWERCKAGMRPNVLERNY